MPQVNEGEIVECTSNFDNQSLCLRLLGTSYEYSTSYCYSEAICHIKTHANPEDEFHVFGRDINIGHANGSRSYLVIKSLASQLSVLVRESFTGTRISRDGASITLVRLKWYSVCDGDVIVLGEGPYEDCIRLQVTVTRPIIPSNSMDSVEIVERSLFISEILPPDATMNKPPPIVASALAYTADSVTLKLASTTPGRPSIIVSAPSTLKDDRGNREEDHPLDSSMLLPVAPRPSTRDNTEILDATLRSNMGEGESSESFSESEDIYAGFDDDYDSTSSGSTERVDTLLGSRTSGDTNCYVSPSKLVDKPLMLPPAPPRLVRDIDVYPKVMPDSVLSGKDPVELQSDRHHAARDDEMVSTYSLDSDLSAQSSSKEGGRRSQSEKSDETSACKLENVPTLDDYLQLISSPRKRKREIGWSSFVLGSVLRSSDCEHSESSSYKKSKVAKVCCKCGGRIPSLPAASDSRVDSGDSNSSWKQSNLKVRFVGQCARCGGYITPSLSFRDGSRIILPAGPHMQYPS